MAEQSHRPQGWRSFITAAAAGLTFVLGGCQIIPDGNVPDRPPPVEEPVTPVTTTPPPPVSALPQDESRNRVAVLVPITGENAGVGQSIANAANQALLDTGGERIRITVYDTAQGAAAAANQALADGNGLFLGPLLAENAREIAPIAARAGVPIISFSNDVSVAGDGVFIMGFTPDQSIDRVVSYARSKGMERFAGLIPNGIYGRRASQAFIDAVERHGGRMVAMQTYDRSPADLKAAIGQLNAQSGYDAVLIADNGRIAMAAGPAIRSGPSGQAKILGTELWKTEPDITEAASLRGAWFASVPDAMFEQLRARYRSRYKENPYRLASLGYDAVLLAVRLAADWPIGARFPKDELRDPGGFSGIDGTFRFREDGVAERTLEVLEVNADGFATISPAPEGF